MKARVVLMISVLAVFLFAGIGLSDESPISSNSGDKGSRASNFEGNVTEKWSETESSTDDRIAPQGTEVENNTFYGYQAGFNNTGFWNTFIGSTAGYGNTTGIENVFIGHEAGHDNTEAEQNVFIGWRAGYKNETADGNVFIGSQAGTVNETGLRNAYVGYHAGAWISNRSDNTLMGYEAGVDVNASGNTFIGSYAGASSSSSGSHYAQSNTFIGADAGKDITEGDQNTFVGRGSGENITEGSKNTFLGYQTGHLNNTGGNNVYLGYEAGYSSVGGENNTMLGYWAGYLNSSGDGNVFLGYFAGAAETGSNKLYIDNRGITTPLIWGDFNTNNVVIYGGFRAIASYSSSDARWKRNIEPLASSLDKISSLQGVSYEWKTDEYPDFGLVEGQQIGLVAQDVEKVLPELVSEDKDGYKSVSYTKLTAVLVEAVKELKAENQRQKELMEKQQAEIETLRSMIKGS